MGRHVDALSRPCQTPLTFPGTLSLASGVCFLIIAATVPYRSESWKCCRKGDPTSKARDLDSCLTFGNELSEETHVLTKEETWLGRGAQAESSPGREPRRTALPRGSQSRVLWWWDSFLDCLWPIVLIQSSSWWCMHGLAKMDASEKDSGRWSDTWCLLLTFPKLFLLVVAS